MRNLKNIIYVFILSFLFIFNVNAETGVVTDKSGVNLRDKPTTSGNVVTVLPYNVEFHISNTDLESGNGCASNWYYIYYNNNYGYVCSNMVKILGELDTSYNRPWTSPKKAIIGGAEFISKGYISRGQYTSYLKKFNVNPEGYYAVYNHQYMANLRAPSSEALTTYKSIKDNNLLESPFNFVIPEFLDMPETTYDKNIKDTGLKVADVQDDKFEASIKDFHDSYKPYLRYLHSIHPSWTFTVMKTNLDFEVSYLSEKAVSSIEISSGLCEQNPYYQTEKGWCIGSEAATKFFLDPRNFLSENYIFMFENLGYSDLYNEVVVQSVLKDTFMNNMSLLDSQSYSSIFVEAGKAFKVSPLYLASLARQESGVKETNTTNGAEFSYEGYSYKGLYNFFNIGAYSSEANPALAGLVWANGGKSNVISGEVNVVPLPNEPEKAESKIDFLTLLKVNKVGEYLKGYELGTNIKAIKNNISGSGTLVVKDADGNLKNDADLVGTGYIFELSNSNQNETYTYVMYGDLSGDGVINSADLLKMRQYLLGQVKLEGAFLTSAYLSEDEEVNSADLLKLRQHLLGTSTLVQ